MPRRDDECHFRTGADQDDIGIAARRVGQNVSAPSQPLGGGELIPIESRDILPCQHQSHRPVARFYGDPPCNGGLIGVARTNDGQLRDGAQRRYLLDGLMGRSVFTDPDAIVGENVDHSKLH